MDDAMSAQRQMEQGLWEGVPPCFLGTQTLPALQYQPETPSLAAKKFLYKGYYVGMLCYLSIFPGGQGVELWILA